MVQKTWAFYFRMCNIPTNRSPREETNYVKKDKSDEKMNLGQFSKTFCRKTTKNYRTTTEILTAKQRSLFVQLVPTSGILEPYMQKETIYNFGQTCQI